MKIKTKILLGFSVLLALMVGITTFGYDRMSRMNERMGSFYDHRFSKVLDVIDLRSTVDTSGRAVSDTLLRQGDVEANRIAELKRNLGLLQTQAKSLSERSNDPDEQQMVDQATRDIAAYADFLQKFVDRIEGGDRQGALGQYESSGRSLQDEVAGSLGSLVTFEQKTMGQELDRSSSMYDRSIRWVAMLTVLGLFIGLGVMLWVLPSFTKGLNLLSLMASKFGQGRLRGFGRLEVQTADELGQLAAVFKQIALDLQRNNDREALYKQAKEQQNWLDGQMVRTTELLKDISDLRGVAQSFIDEFAPVLGAAYGAVYLLDDCEPAAPGRLCRFGSYAYSGSDAASAGNAEFVIGEGLVGQCALSGDPIAVESLPGNYMPIRSGLGEAAPTMLLLQPVKADGRTVGVVELAYSRPPGEMQRQLLERIGEKFAYIVMNIQSRRRVEQLLRESQAMTEELQAQSEELISQQEELRETNEKLELHAGRLKRSEERLQRQQEELEHTNQELTVKTLALEEQNRQAERKSREIAKANAALERQTMQLTLTSQYKSEFLANMSHELRTPLNSLIILSQFLVDNPEGNLTDKQLEYVKTIYSSGDDLLRMIDEILDLAKVDAGRMDISLEQTLVEDITTDLEHMYGSIAKERGVDFEVEPEPDAPAIVRTDGHRLKQILRNLLSNAVKFTSEGSIRLRLRRADADEIPEETADKGPFVVFEVADTGIGIPADKKEVIFEAFRQADGTTSRNFGGTGLGLTISRELAHLLGGWIVLTSEPGRGSTFSLFLPENGPVAPGAEEESSAPADGNGDDRPSAGEAAAASEAEDAPTEDAQTAAGMPAPSPAPAEETSPETDSPDSDDAGDAASKPQEPASARAEEPKRSSRTMAFDAAWAGKTVLLVDDDARNVFSLTSLLEHHSISVESAENGREALERLHSGPKPDLVLMDIMMPEMDGYEAMRRIRADARLRDLPIIALTAKAMKEDRDKCLEAGASDYLAKPVMIDQLLSLLKVWLSR